ncbi:DnaJ/Hsp40 cysteine-rich domain-containing protein [Cinnamomum micranthum f. kanehirae]|uniref:DnaJ/Hsp40 cysteine-rich domain-containing protein n=1 Tax=Cinnamomum micranthum f. kanehirae TaxID=337451 RepID=A0A3S3MVB6_9MAGN|nr:DnaJ/Hsp40 cysteine-rich domain-containing protein [Cinnamomum micranthum f. kanehirae]
MVNALCFSPIASYTRPIKSGFLIDTEAQAPKLHRIDTFRSQSARFHSCKSKAADSSNQRTNPNSIVCADCDGNGAVLCSQCKGNGVNSVDHFNGQFKAGGLCWLCRGKREMLCGNCNGAGFLGGFMSSFDE